MSPGHLQNSGIPSAAQTEIYKYLLKSSLLKMSPVQLEMNMKEKLRWQGTAVTDKLPTWFCISGL